MDFSRALYAELDSKGVFSKNVIEEAIAIRLSMAIPKTQKNSAKHVKLLYIATHQALIRTTGQVDRERLSSIFGLSPEEGIKVFTTFTPLQLGIRIISEPDSVEGCIRNLCRHPEFRLYDENTVQIVCDYASMCMSARPRLAECVPYTVAVAILFDFMQNNGIQLQDMKRYYEIVGLRSVTIDSIRRIIRG